jgi:hypothetical protein
MDSSRKRNQISSSSKVAIESINILCPVPVVSCTISSGFFDVLDDRGDPDLVVSLI